MKNLIKKSIWKAGLAMLTVLFLSCQTTENVYAEEEQEVGTETNQTTELSAAEGTLGSLRWSLSEGVLTISGAGEMVADEEIYPWEEYIDEIKKVIIGDEVTSIGAWAFYEYELLEDVNIGKKVEVIGKEAFCKCSSLTGILLPPSMKIIDRRAFAECKELINLTWYEGLESIGGGAFAQTALTEVAIPDSVKVMDDAAFSMCPELKTVTIGDGIKRIRIATFLVCEKLDTVIFGEHVEVIEQSALGGTALKNLVIPDSVTELLPGTFSGCDELKMVIIGKGVTTLCGGAISSPQLETVVLSENVKVINEDAFFICPELKNIKIYSKDVEYPDRKIFRDCPQVTLYGFPGSTTEAYAKKYGIPFQPIVLPATPVHKKISNTVSGISLYWEEVSGAKTYTLYRAFTKDGEYEVLAEGLTATNCMDKAVESGKTYFYKITATDGTEVSEMSEAKGINFVGTPDITSRANSAYGIRLGWNKVEGATGYAIYRKSYAGNDAWVRVATISGNATFTWLDESVKTKNGEIYKYTVRALAGSKLNTLSGCRTSGRTMVRLTSRNLTQTVKKTATAIQCTWTTTAKATGYEVRFMVGDKVYKTFTVGNYKTGVKTFKDLPAGKKYKVQVRSYKKVEGVGGFYSAWSTAKYVEL